LDESNKRTERILTGKYNRDEILDAQKEAEIQLKAVNQYIQIMAVASKNERAMATLRKKGIMDGFTTIALPTDGEVHCKERDVSISKEECLDYSGSHTECQDCEVFGHTRKVVLGEV
jgi:hypothetical protein